VNRVVVLNSIDLLLLEKVRLKTKEYFRRTIPSTVTIAFLGGSSARLPSQVNQTLLLANREPIAIYFRLGKFF
jgi:hypothetical protein